MATVTITNILTKVIADGKEAFAPISPTCVPVPCTPVQEYISDMVTLTDGTLLVPAFKKFQKLSIPFGAKTTFEVTEPDEINYWENIKLVGAKVEVADGLIELVEPYTYNAVTFVDSEPAFEANKFYKVEDDEYVVLDEAPADWGTPEADGKYFTRTENVLPTNDVKGE